MQEAAMTTVGIDLTAPSAISQEQWTLVCWQLGPILTSEHAEMADFKNCSLRLRNMVEVGKKNCPTNTPDSDKEAETAFFKTVLGLACQGVKTMVSWYFSHTGMLWTIVIKFRCTCSYFNFCICTFFTRCTYNFYASCIFWTWSVCTISSCRKS